MDWASIGQWAGDKGPFVGIIMLQWGVIGLLLKHHFALQEMVMKALTVTEKTTAMAQTAVAPSAEAGGVNSGAF